MKELEKQKSLKVLEQMRFSPVLFVKIMWWLIPQPFVSKDVEQVAHKTPLSMWKKEWFWWFTKWLHITWQQYLILLSVERAVKWLGKKRISIRSGHWIWKSCTFSWLLLWYLYCYKNSQIPCTAPTSDQIHDVLWKEVAKWKNQMPDWIKDMYEWSNWYVRVTEAPEVWFARAKTAKKENPEALAWVHWDYVMLLVDEASWVPEEIFNTAEWALTSWDVVYLMISNPTRLIWFFYDSHHWDKENWQTLWFSCMDSPIVDLSYVQRIEEKHWKDSDEYRVRVLWEFPKEDAVDDKWYVPLLNDSDMRKISDIEFIMPENDEEKTNTRMWVDPAWEWDDETVWVLRDKFKAKVILKEKKSNPKSIAQKTITLMSLYKIKSENVFIDSFWEWTDCIQELAFAWYRINAVNVWKPPDDKEKFINIRAENYWRLKEWLRQWWELIEINNKEWEELKTIRYRPELNWKLKIMSKIDMKKEWYQSPNKADALMMTFSKEEVMEEINLSDVRLTNLRFLKRKRNLIG